MDTAHQHAEDSRKVAEIKRQDAEGERHTAEGQRHVSEETRLTAEEWREEAMAACDSMGLSRLRLFRDLDSLGWALTESCKSGEDPFLL